MCSQLAPAAGHGSRGRVVRIRVAELGVDGALLGVEEDRHPVGLDHGAQRGVTEQVAAHACQPATARGAGRRSRVVAVEVHDRLEPLGDGAPRGASLSIAVSARSAVWTIAPIQVIVVSSPTGSSAMSGRRSANSSARLVPMLWPPQRLGRRAGAGGRARCRIIKNPERHRVRFGVDRRLRRRIPGVCGVGLMEGNTRRSCVQVDIGASSATLVSLAGSVNRAHTPAWSSLNDPAVNAAEI